MLPSDEFCRITHIFAGAAVPTGAAVVYCVRIGSTQPPLETAQVCHDAFGSNVVEMFTSDISLTSTLCKEGPDVSGAQAEAVDPVYTGLSDTASIVPNVALLVIKNTAGGGRRGRGRLFMPGLSEPQILDSGMVDPASVAIYQDGFDAWYEALASANIPLALEHGPETHWVLRNGQPRRVPNVGAIPNPTDATSVVVMAKCATQRRRLRR